MRILLESVAVDGPLLRKLRKLRGTTQTVLADAAGISFQYVSLIERGARPRISQPVFVRICTALDLAPQERRRLLRDGGRSTS